MLPVFFRCFVVTAYQREVGFPLTLEEERTSLAADYLPCIQIAAQDIDVNAHESTTQRSSVSKVGVEIQIKYEAAYNPLTANMAYR
jgi:hypothetical protein